MSNATHPNALDQLNRITHENLRIVPKGGRLFHPKLYLFRRSDGAVTAMEELIRITHVKHGTATLLLTLARPSRLLSVNAASEEALGELSGIDTRDLRKPEGYGNLLRWLYRQRWYADGPPANENRLWIWRFRAALVDAFAYERE